MPDYSSSGSSMEETAEYAFYYCEQVDPFWDHLREWTARIEAKQLVLLDVGYVVDNVLSPFQGEKRVVFLAILAPDRMVIWTTRKKGLYDDAKLSHCDLSLYFRHQLRVKIRCDRKRLDRITFYKRWVNVAKKVGHVGVLLPSSSSAIILAPQPLLHPDFMKTGWEDGSLTKRGIFHCFLHSFLYFRLFLPFPS